jgi:hypothetical protein
MRRQWVVRGALVWIAAILWSRGHIVDRARESCPLAGAGKSTTNGFDLDAIVRAELP